MGGYALLWVVGLSMAGFRGVQADPLDSESPNLLCNHWLDYDSGEAPDYWYVWNATGQSACVDYYTSADNSWQMFGSEEGLWQDVTTGFVPGDTMRYGAYVLTPSSDPLSASGPQSYDYPKVYLEFYNATNGLISSTDPYMIRLLTNDVWYTIDRLAIVPDGTAKIRFLVRPANAWYVYKQYGGRFMIDDPLLANQYMDVGHLKNVALNGTGSAPQDWMNWNDGSHDPDWGTFYYPENSWSFWWDGGIYQDVAATNLQGFSCAFGAKMLTPSWDALRNGTKNGAVQLEYYNGATWLSTYSANTINSSSPQDQWIQVQGVAPIPTNATTARIVIRCNDYSSGDGRFLADAVVMKSSVKMDGNKTTHLPRIMALNGKPAVLFHRYDSDYRLRNRCFSTDTSSNIFSGAWVNQTNTYYWLPERVELGLIGNLPFFACCVNYGSVDARGLFVYCCTNSDFSGVWRESRITLVDWEEWSQDPYPLGVSGLPSVTLARSMKKGAMGNYTYSTALEFLKNSGADAGGLWTTNRIHVATGLDSLRNENMTLIGGMPAACFAALSNNALLYAVSPSTNGAGTWSVYTVATNTTVFNSTTNFFRAAHLAQVNSRPAIAYVDGSALKYAYATNVAGSGSWTKNTVESGIVPITPVMTVINGNPAIAYCATNTASLKYAVNSLATGLGTWSVCTLASDCASVGGMIDIGNKPCIVYRTLSGVSKIIQ
jgi:hypothetical protein